MGKLTKYPISFNLHISDVGNFFWQMQKLMSETDRRAKVTRQPMRAAVWPTRAQWFCAQGVLSSLCQPCARCWGFESEQDRHEACPQGAWIWQERRTPRPVTGGEVQAVGWHQEGYPEEVALGLSPGGGERDTG